TKGMEIDSKTFLFAKNAIKDFFNATPQKIRNNYKKSEMSGKIQENSNYTFNSKNVCEWCQKHGRTKIQHTHKTIKCFYGDRNGSTKFNKNNDQNYFVLFTILDQHQEAISKIFQTIAKNQILLFKLQIIRKYQLLELDQ